MPRLVRARVKRVEDLPDWTKCCEGALACNLSLGDMVVDLSRQHIRSETACKFCGRTKGPDAVVPDVADNMYVSLELLDLDEGPMEAA